MTGVNMSRKIHRCFFLSTVLLVGLVLLEVVGYAQTNETIFPNLTGQELLDSLVANYKTNTVLSYNNARDTLFALIYQHNDSLSCVYTGYTIYLDPTQDPSTYAYNNGINTEHTWPQSKGAVGQAKSDMHHLYPVRSVVNSSRGNDPFAESPDVDTDKWYRLDYYLDTIPTQFINEYSEKDNDADIFEPREDHKGNVSRAMFYFYTMYKHEADSCDTAYFQIQKDVLYQWHIAEPVDSMEWIRNDLIASYQGDKKNPFILDSSLVRRAYFPNHSIELLPNEFELKQNYPNPYKSQTTIQYSLAEDSKVTLKVYNVLGQEIQVLVDKFQSSGVHHLIWDGNDDPGKRVPSGVYFLRFNAGEYTATKKLLIMR